MNGTRLVQGEPWKWVSRDDVLRMRLKAVSFDVGGTLIDPWPSVGHVYAAVAAESGLPAYDPAVLTAQFVAAWRAKATFDSSRAAWASLVVSTFGGSEGEFGL